MSALSDKLASLGITTPHAVPKSEAALIAEGKGPDDVPASSASPIADVLQHVTSKRQRAEVKGAAWADVGPKAREDFGDFDVQIVDIVQMNGGVAVFARAWDSEGNQIGFEDGTVDIQRFRVFNPPILTPDGTKQEVDDGEGGTIEIDNFEENVELALKRDLNHTIKVCGKVLASDSIVEGKVGNTVSTFYPDAGSPAANAVDGMVRRDSVNETWATITGGNGTANFPTSLSDAVPYFKASTTSSQWQENRRGMRWFYTAALGSDVISSATFSIYGNTKVDDLSATPDVTIVGNSSIGTTTLNNSDYENSGSTEFTDSRITYAAFDIAGYNDFALNAAGLAAIDGSGVTRITVINGNYDIDGSSPSWSSGAASYLQSYTADQTGTTNDPKLVVTHVSAAIAAGKRGMAVV